MHQISALNQSRKKRRNRLTNNSLRIDIKVLRIGSAWSLFSEPESGPRAKILDFVDSMQVIDWVSITQTSYIFINIRLISAVVISLNSSNKELSNASTLIRISLILVKI